MKIAAAPWWHRTRPTRRTRQLEQRAAVLEQRVRTLADDLDDGRLDYLFASDIAAALRGLLDEAVL